MKTAKTFYLSVETLATLLGLPDGVEVVTARRTDCGQIQIIVADQTDQLPANPITAYNRATNKLSFTAGY